jgi:undecaprenyl pyrophosphate synthase
MALRPANGGLHVGLIMDGNGRWPARAGSSARRDTVAGPTWCDARWKRHPGSA